MKDETLKMTPLEIIKSWQRGERPLVVLGLGYVGLPIAIEFAKHGPVIGYDYNQRRIDELSSNYDRTREVEAETLKESSITFSSNEESLKNAAVIIVTVPTPVNHQNTPDLSMLLSASKTIGKNISNNVIVVYESTVYPGATEEECIPVLANESNLKLNEDFFVGYSPERISPADPVHTFSNINKVVSGSSIETLDAVFDLYSLVVKAELHKASSIKVAEAAKVIENAQRDINVAFVNELAVIFDKLGINTSEVLAAAKTKWNFLDFRPGLVGGHCIGVDPYYLAFKAKSVGIQSDVILSGREINNEIPYFIANKVIEDLSQKYDNISDAKVGILGLTFKENCPDIRNSKVFDIQSELLSRRVNVVTYDPFALPEDVLHEYNVVTNTMDDFFDLDVLILAVAHNEFKSMSSLSVSKTLLPNGLLMDVKSMYSPNDIKSNQIRYWSL